MPRQKSIDQLTTDELRSLLMEKTPVMVEHIFTMKM